MPWNALSRLGNSGTTAPSTAIQTTSWQRGPTSVPARRSRAVLTVNSARLTANATVTAIQHHDAASHCGSSGATRPMRNTYWSANSWLPLSAVTILVASASGSAVRIVGSATFTIDIRNSDTGYIASSITA